MEKISGLLPSNLPLPSQTINPKPRQTPAQEFQPQHKFTVHDGPDLNLGPAISYISLIYLVVYLDDWGIIQVPLVSRGYYIYVLKMYFYIHASDIHESHCKT